MSSKRGKGNKGQIGYVNEGYIGGKDDPINLGPDGFQTINLNDNTDGDFQVNNFSETKGLNFSNRKGTENVSYDSSSSSVSIQAGSPVGEPPPSEDTKEVEDQLCGWRLLKPRWIQKFRTAKWALFFLSCACGLQGMVVNGFVNVIITTIEKRFGLRSSQTGLIAGGYDIASFICLIPVTYLGGNIMASKPRWLGWGTAIMGLGSLVFAIPHFTIGTYRGGAETNSICLLQSNTSSSETACSTSDDGSDGKGVSFYVWVFLAGQLLHGIGASPLFTLGVTYLDENVSKKMSSVYLGIYYTMSVIGPALGYVIGGQLLMIYSDFMTIDPSEIGLTPSSNIWIGAWWIGFILSAILCGIVAIPILAFPPSLPGSEELRKERVSEAHAGAAGQTEAFSKLRELPRAFITLMRNPTLFFLNLAGASEGLLVAGFAAFLPKLIENQFSVNATEAALLMGLITVPAGGGGTFLGGYLVKRLKLHCSGIMKLCIFATIAGVLFAIGFILSCPNLPYAGVTQPYNHDQNITLEFRAMTLESPCNSGCSCSQSNFDPVCGSDGIMYYSPCYAGCIAEAVSPDFKMYGECACIDAPKTFKTLDKMPEFSYHNNDMNFSGNFYNIFGQKEKLKSMAINNYTDEYISSGDSIAIYSEAQNQMCESTCTYLWLFIVLTFGIMVFTFLATMPALAATLRCVQDDQRSFALGIQWIKVRLLGTIPAPMIFGALIDETCILWQNSCDGNGACLVYDNSYMSKYMLALAFTGKMCSLLFFILAWWFYKPPQSAAEINSSCLPSIDLKMQSNKSGHTNNSSNGYVNNTMDSQSEHF